jgi:hypothetical protein
MVKVEIDRKVRGGTQPAVPHGKWLQASERVVVHGYRPVVGANMRIFEVGAGGGRCKRNPCGECKKPTPGGEGSGLQQRPG